MSSIPLDHSLQSVSRLLESDTLDSLENDVKVKVTTFLTSLNRYKTNLSQKEDRLLEKERLGLSSLTDDNSLAVIRNLKTALDEKNAEFETLEKQSVTNKDKITSLETSLKQKSEHIEKLSSLLLLKEEKIQSQEVEFRTAQTKIEKLEETLASKSETSEKWREVAQSAAGKMREQRANLKATEEMNQDLRKMLDKKVHDKFSAPDELDNSNIPYQFALSPICSSSSSSREPIQITKAEVVYKTVDLPKAVNLGTSTTQVNPTVVRAQDDRDRYLVSSPRPVSISVSELEDPGSSTPRIIYRLSDAEEGLSLQEIQTTESGCVGYPAPYPKFSKIVEDAIDTGRIHDPVLWRYFIRECVHFYYDLLPTTDCAARNSYYNIGRTLYEKFPCIAKEGPNFKTPWTYFNTCLSSRLRNERFTKKRASERHSQIYVDNRDDVTSGESLLPAGKRMRVMEQDAETSSAERWQNEGCHL